MGGAQGPVSAYGDGVGGSQSRLEQRLLYFFSFLAVLGLAVHGLSLVAVSGG